MTGPVSCRCLLALLMALGGASTPAPAAAGAAHVLDVEGAIGPATADYVDRSLARAESGEAVVVILRMDTPGGLDTSMRAIIKRIIGSRVPVVSFVAPGGARAASAGTYILYASHVAAMAPGTNLGAATPVELGGLSRPESEPANAGGGDAPGAATAKDVKRDKLVNDAAAYLVSLARLRGRNESWAEEAVRAAASLPAEQALELGVIDLVARDLDELQQRLDGRVVELQGGRVTLRTQGLQRVTVEPDWRSRVLSVIANPNVAYMLLLIGIYGIIYEFSNPGTFLPGTAGAVCLLLALYAFQVLPVNYAGLALLVLGLGLMAGEAFVPSFGALGIGGIVAFVLGSLILIDSEQPGYAVSLPLILGLAVFSALLLVAVLGLALRARRRPVVSGTEEMASALGVALEDFAGEGRVRVHGEVWEAQSAGPVRRGQRVRVTGRRGLVLEVVGMDREE